MKIRKADRERIRAKYAVSPIKKRPCPDCKEWVEDRYSDEDEDGFRYGADECSCGETYQTLEPLPAPPDFHFHP